MSRLIKIGDWTGEKRGNAVFVHGLGGHPYDTWRRSSDDRTLWPVWLAEEVKGLSVYSLGYISPPTNWLGTAMPLLDEAANVLRLLLNEDGLRTGPIAFICHSLGGLIVKQVLRAANEQKSDPGIADFLIRTRQVIFIATPHTGSGKANLLERVKFLAWGSDSAKDLVANSPELRDLNFGYRELARLRGDQLTHLIYYEMVDTVFGRIVDPGSADPGLPNCRPIPIRQNHITIAKPHRRDDLVYTETKALISRLVPEPNATGKLRIYLLEPFKVERSWHQLFPKLVRLLALCLLAFGLWQGLPRITDVVRSIISTEEKVSEIKTKTTETAEQIAALSRQIADLQAAHAIQSVTSQAKEQAIKSLDLAITDLAQRADERSKRAFEALERGDTSVAEELFRENLEEKTHEGIKANREAAEAARNIAAFKRLTNVIEAADLYSRAAFLDPDDYQTQIDLGDMSVAAGRLIQARAAFERAFIIAEGLAKADPGNAGWQSDLSVSHNKIGDVQVEQGNLPAALTSYQASHDIFERLAKVVLGNAGWQRELSVSHDKIGDVQRAQGNLPAALTIYQASHDIAERLAKVDPGNAGWQHDLSVSHDRIGDVQVEQGNLPAALTSYQASHDIFERLAKVDPGNADWQRDLSVSHERIGDVQRAQGNLPAALTSYQASLAIAERLAKVDPGNAGWQHDLSVSHANIAAILQSGEQRLLAQKHLATGRAIMARLVEQYPDQAEWQRDLAWFEKQIAVSKP